MSQAISTDAHERPSEELSGFFGAEQAQPAEEIPAEVWSGIDEYLERNRGGQERLIPLLHRVQGQLGYLPFPVQEVIADKLGLSPIQVYGVVSFYHFFTTTPRGKHELKVCMGTACFVRHALRLVETAKQTLGIEVGEVTEDQLFGLEQVRCIGACGLAPAMMHNAETLGELTPKTLRKMLVRLQSQERRRKKLEAQEASGE
jgi:NADH-quinone oxidoreductase subunit E/NADP-reducing hydrogenase subunit HndA